MQAGVDGVLKLNSPHCPMVHLDFNEECNHCS